MEDLKEKFEIETISWKNGNQDTKRRSITKDDLWLIDHISSSFDHSIPMDGYLLTFVHKVKQPTVNSQIKDLMLKAKYEMGGDKYCEMKKEFENIQ